MRMNEKYFIALLVHIYDIIIISNNIESIDYMRSVMDEKFKIKDFRSLNYFINIEIVR